MGLTWKSILVVGGGDGRESVSGEVSKLRTIRSDAMSAFGIAASYWLSETTFYCIDVSNSYVFLLY